MVCTQAGVLKPAHNVLSCHMFQSLSQGIIETCSRSRRNSTEKLLGLRPQLLDRCIVRNCTAAEATPRPRPARSLLSRRRTGGGGGCQTRRRRPHPVQAQRGNDGQRLPGSGDRADRSPRGAQAWVGVIAVLTPVSSTKTSRFGSIRRTCLRNRRRFSGTSGRLRSAACRVFSLEVRPRRRRVCQMVVGVQLKPPCCFRWFNVASFCFWTNRRSRCWSQQLKAGLGPPPCGLGAKVPALRHRCSSRTRNDRLTRCVGSA